MTCASRWLASTRRARSSTTSSSIAIRRPRRRSVDRRKPALPGFTNEPAQITTYRAGFDAFWELDVFGRDPLPVRAAAATADSFERRARRRARERGGGSGAQLLRAARTAAAAGRVGAQPRESAGDAASDPGAPRRRASARSRTSPARRRAWRRSKRACRRSAARSRSASIALRCRSRAAGRARVSIWRRAPYPMLAKALPLGEPDAPSRRPDVRAAERRLAASTRA